MPDQVLCRVHGPDGGRRVSCPADSLAEAARFEPAAGVYTVDRTYPGGKVVALDRHFDRLEGSARAEGMLLRVDRAALRTLLREMLDESGFDLARFRLSVAEDRPDEVRITMERFRPVPLEVRSKGVRCVRVGSHRYHPQSKTLGWMHGREALPESVYEGLLSSSAGEILEGLSSNFFAITADTLRTAGDEVLFGMARGVVLQIAPAIVAVALRAISWDEITQCQESFLTSSTRGIIPIVRIDDRQIGNGTPGPRTLELARVYESWITAHLEDLTA